jgi:hypothetical protein
MNSGDEIVVHRLRAKEKELLEQAEQIRKTLEHIQGVIALYQPKPPNKFPLVAVEEAVAAATEAITSIPTSRLKGLTHEAAVIAIAKYNGGIVRTQEAKRLMIKAGIMSPTKNSTNMAHNAIMRSKKFEKVSPGEYRLKGEPIMPTSTGLENLARSTYSVSKPVQ